jgi:CspA family cold shock protein
MSSEITVTGRGVGRVEAADTEFGTVRWYDDAKGYGFITTDAGNSDVFLHARALPLNAVPREGDRIKFILQRQPDGRWRAARATLVTP